MEKLKKKLILSFTIATLLLITGCGNKTIEDKEKITINTGKVTSGIIIGKPLADFTLKDQFDKEHKLTNNVKKVIFAFSKPTGHIMKVYMGTRKSDYLTSRDIIFIADISGMPTVIANMFAIPDLQESEYPVLLIKEKENAKIFRDEKQKNAIMIISLDNKIVKSVKFVTNKDDLKNEID